MAVLPVLAVGILMKFVAALFVLVSILLILVILVQKGRGGGLSGALGGGMAGGLLGSKTGDFLTWVTIGLVAVFLILAVLMAKFYRTEVSSFGEEMTPPVRQNAPRETPGATPGTGAAAPSGEANAPAATAPRTGADGNKPATSAPAPKTDVNAPAGTPRSGPADANKAAGR